MTQEQDRLSPARIEKNKSIERRKFLSKNRWLAAKMNIGSRRWSACCAYGQEGLWRQPRKNTSRWKSSDATIERDKRSREKRPALAPVGRATGDHRTRSAKREPAGASYLDRETKNQDMENLNGNTEPAAHCAGKKLVLSKQNTIRNRVKSTLWTTNWFLAHPATNGKKAWFRSGGCNTGQGADLHRTGNPTKKNSNSCSSSRKKLTCSTNHLRAKSDVCRAGPDARSGNEQPRLTKN
jgi:hypothetical protein